MAGDDSSGNVCRPRDTIKKMLEEALRPAFPNDTVDISDGYKDNIHVLVVSRQFDEMDEREKREILWDLVDASDLNETEKGLISLMMAVSPAAIK